MSRLASALPPLLALVGLAVLVAGVALFSLEAGLIVAGIICVALAVAWTRGGREEPKA